jgi:hypothetical protein
MTLYPLGSPVLLRNDLGTVRKVFANGFAYQVVLADGTPIICVPSVLKKAPENVVVADFRCASRPLAIATANPGPGSAA